MYFFSLQIITWNVGSSKPLSAEDLIDLLKLSEDDSADIYAIG